MRSVVLLFLCVCVIIHWDQWHTYIRVAAMGPHCTMMKISAFSPASHKINDVDLLLSIHHSIILNRSSCAFTHQMSWNMFFPFSREVNWVKIILHVSLAQYHRFDRQKILTISVLSFWLPKLIFNGIYRQHNIFLRCTKISNNELSKYARGFVAEFNKIHDSKYNHLRKITQ